VGSADIATQRLRNQRLAGPRSETAEEVVHSLGAVQAQDFGAAKWGVAQRTEGVTDSELDRVFAEGAILRTHLMRPTWHFVVPGDIRWMLQLTAPRVHAANAYYYRKLELDGLTFQRSNKALEKALGAGSSLTRTELARVLEDAGIVARGPRLAYLLMRAELDAVICSGPRRGKQFTYSLLDARAPGSSALTREEALAELATRYFSGHGPALLEDYAWWSGLTLAEARVGVEIAGPKLLRESRNGRSYWRIPSTASSGQTEPAAHLLPNYDEYLIAYRDHDATLDPGLFPNRAALESALGGHILVLDGQVAGGWRRTVQGHDVTVDVAPVRPLSTVHREELQRAAERYGVFLGLRPRLRINPPAALPGWT
jgi:hypothetical protein